MNETARIFNSTAAKIAIGILLASVASCLAILEFGDTPGNRIRTVDEINALTIRIISNSEDDEPYQELLARAQSRWWFERSKATSALGPLGARARTAIPILIKNIDDPSGFVQRNAVIALGRVARESMDTGAAVEALKHKLKDGGDVAWFAADALAQLGPAARTAESELRAATQSEDSILVQKAKRALINLELIPKPYVYDKPTDIDTIMGVKKN